MSPHIGDRMTICTPGRVVLRSDVPHHDRNFPTPLMVVEKWTIGDQLDNSVATTVQLIPKQFF